MEMIHLYNDIDGYIGYVTREKAEEIKRYWGGTYLETNTRLTALQAQQIFDKE